MRVKATVVKKYQKKMLAVLNGDDEHCIKNSEDLNCNVAYFSLSEDNDFIKKLCAEGKTVAVYENGYITIKKGEWKTERASHVPLTLEEKLNYDSKCTCRHGKLFMGI
jgi:cyanophycin synthetase